MNLYEIFLGQVPEAVYFTLFLIFAKSLKERRILFTVLMTLEYVLLLQAFPYSTWSHVLYFALSFVILKIVYKDKSNITDVFTLGIASILLIPISIVSFVLSGEKIILSSIISIILKFGLLLTLKHKLPKITNIYNCFWNRNEKPKAMKSTTFRALNLVLLNLSIAIIDIGMFIAIIYNS